MRAPGARPEAVIVGAGVGAGQVQHPAAELPVFLDLVLGLGGAARELAVLCAGADDLVQGFLEARVVELQMHAQLGAQVGVAVGDHVDALDRGDRLDCLHPLHRFDRGAENDVLVGRRAVLGLIAPTEALVAGVRAHLRDTAVADGGYFASCTMARASSAVSTSEICIPIMPWSRMPGIWWMNDLWSRTMADTSVAANHAARSAIVSMSKAPCSMSIMQ